MEFKANFDNCEIYDIDTINDPALKTSTDNYKFKYITASKFECIVKAVQLDRIRKSKESIWNELQTNTKDLEINSENDLHRKKMNKKRLKLAKNSSSAISIFSKPIKSRCVKSDYNLHQSRKHHSEIRILTENEIKLMVGKAMQKVLKQLNPGSLLPLERSLKTSKFNPKTKIKFKMNSHESSRTSHGNREKLFYVASKSHDDTENESNKPCYILPNDCDNLEQNNSSGNSEEPEESLETFKYECKPKCVENINVSPSRDLLNSEKHIPFCESFPCIYKNFLANINEYLLLINNIEQSKIQNEKIRYDRQNSELNDNILSTTDDLQAVAQCSDFQNNMEEMNLNFNDKIQENQVVPAQEILHENTLDQDSNSFALNSSSNCELISNNFGDREKEEEEEVEHLNDEYWALSKKDIRLQKSEEDNDEKNDIEQNIPEQMLSDNLHNEVMENFIESENSANEPPYSIVANNNFQENTLKAGHYSPRLVKPSKTFKSPKQPSKKSKFMNDPVKTTSKNNNDGFEETKSIKSNKNAEITKSRKLKNHINRLKQKMHNNEDNLSKNHLLNINLQSSTENFSQPPLNSPKTPTEGSEINLNVKVLESSRSSLSKDMKSQSARSNKSFEHKLFSPTLKSGKSRLETDNIAILSKITSYQEEIIIMLDQIRQKIKEVEQPENEIEKDKRERRINEFSVRFTRQYLYQIEKLIEEIQLMSKDNSLSDRNYCQIKISTLYGIIQQALQAYLKQIKCFLIDKSAKIIEVLVNYIINSTKVCKHQKIFRKNDHVVKSLMNACKEFHVFLRDLQKYNAYLMENIYLRERKIRKISNITNRLSMYGSPLPKKTLPKRNFNHIPPARPNSEIKISKKNSQDKFKKIQNGTSKKTANSVRSTKSIIFQNDNENVKTFIENLPEHESQTNLVVPSKSSDEQELKDGINELDIEIKQQTPPNSGKEQETVKVLVASFEKYKTNSIIPSKSADEQELKNTESMNKSSSQTVLTSEIKQGTVKTLLATFDKEKNNKSPRTKEINLSSNVEHETLNQEEQQNYNFDSTNNTKITEAQRINQMTNNTKMKNRNVISVNVSKSTINLPAPADNNMGRKESSSLELLEEFKSYGNAYIIGNDNSTLDYSVSANKLTKQTSKSIVTKSDVNKFEVKGNKTTQIDNNTDTCASLQLVRMNDDGSTKKFQFKHNIHYSFVSSTTEIISSDAGTDVTENKIEKLGKDTEITSNKEKITNNELLIDTDKKFVQRIESLEGDHLHFLEKAANNPMYGNAFFSEPWKIIERLSNKICENVLNEIENEATSEEKKFIDNFLNQEFTS